MNDTRKHNILQPAIMDTNSFLNQKSIHITKATCTLVVVVFVLCIVATGVLVYSFISCAPCEEKIPENSFGSSDTVVSDVLTEAILNSTTTEIIASYKDSTEVVEENPKTQDQRLPGDIIPSHYNLKLIPFLEEGNFSFKGEVVITVKVVYTTNLVVLNADDLEVDEASLSVVDLKYNSSFKVLEIGYDKERQFLIINLEETLEVGNDYLIEMNFKGILRDDLQGFYKSSYVERNETRWLAATQFQATDARKAFPCFDEPAMKASFSLSIARPRNMTSISNMPKKAVPTQYYSENNYIWDHFEETPIMSTYLLAFVVSDFKSINKGNFSVWARDEALNQADYALNLGPKLLKFYEGYFGIDFPLPKIDLVALPDFLAGAMENWGIVTYRESLLLYEEGVSSRKSFQGIAAVMAHELAHQWFGNLVTPSWWTDLWLNEGFATYMEYVGTNAVGSEWSTLDEFVISELQSAFTLDVLKNSHQISIKVNKTEEINEIFDRIVYSKSATVIRMMEHFLTTKTFLKGLSTYLKKMAYGSASQDDLWSTLTTQAHEDQVLDSNLTIKEIMDTWTLQTGFPVVTANHTNNSIIFTQKRFIYNLSDHNPPEESWWIPITYKSIRNEPKLIWMKKNETEMTLHSVNIAEEWYLVNVNQTGYYRVNYDLKNWKKITEQLEMRNGHLVFDVKNRAQILDDSFNLAAAGYLDYSVPLNISRYLKQEREYVPLKAALTSLDYLKDMFVRTQHFDKFKSYVLKLLEGVYKEIGFEDKATDPPLKVYTRTEVLWKACALGMVDCLVESVRLFEDWRNSPNPDKYNPISPNLREIIYCTALKVGGQEQWDFAYERYLKTNLGSEKEILMTALGCTRETWLLSRYLEWSLSDERNVRKQDAPRVFAVVADNVVGRDLVYRFLKSNWKRLRDFAGTNWSMISTILKSSTRRFNTLQELEDLKAFVRKVEPELGVTMFLQQSVEQVEANVKWMDEYFEKIVDWLKQNVD